MAWLWIALYIGRVISAAVVVRQRYISNRARSANRAKCEREDDPDSYRYISKVNKRRGQCLQYLQLCKLSLFWTTGYTTISQCPRVEAESKHMEQRHRNPPPTGKRISRPVSVDAIEQKNTALES